MGNIVQWLLQKKSWKIIFKNKVFKEYIVENNLEYNYDKDSEHILHTGKHKVINLKKS